MNQSTVGYESLVEGWGNGKPINSYLLAGVLSTSRCELVFLGGESFVIYLTYLFANVWVFLLLLCHFFLLRVLNDLIDYAQQRKALIFCLVMHEFLEH